MKGKVVKTLHWQDLMGENLLAFTQTGGQRANPKATDNAYDYRESYLFAYHFVKKNNHFEQVWLVQDWVKDCELDIVCEYVLPSLQLSDANKNGIAEISFIYRLACRGDVSPAIQKLIMYEGTTKYAIRGETLYTGIGGKKVVDQSFTKADKRLLSIAQKLWEKHKSED